MQVLTYLQLGWTRTTNTRIRSKYLSAWIRYFMKIKNNGFIRVWNHPPRIITGERNLAKYQIILERINN